MEDVQKKNPPQEDEVALAGLTPELASKSVEQHETHPQLSNDPTNEEEKKRKRFLGPDLDHGETAETGRVAKTAKIEVPETLAVARDFKDVSSSTVPVMSSNESQETERWKPPPAYAASSSVVDLTNEGQEKEAEETIVLKGTNSDCNVSQEIEHSKAPPAHASFSVVDLTTEGQEKEAEEPIGLKGTNSGVAEINETLDRSVLGQGTSPTTEPLTSDTKPDSCANGTNDEVDGMKTDSLEEPPSAPTAGISEVDNSTTSDLRTKEPVTEDLDSKQTAEQLSCNDPLSSVPDSNSDPHEIESREASVPDPLGSEPEQQPTEPLPSSSIPEKEFSNSNSIEKPNASSVQNEPQDAAKNRPVRVTRMAARRRSSNSSSQNKEGGTASTASTTAADNSKEPVTEPPAPEAAPSTATTRKRNSVVYEYVGKLDELSVVSTRVTKLSEGEVSELEWALELDTEGGWRDDWNGNILLADKEISNPSQSGKKRKPTFKQSLLNWAEKSEYSVKLLRNLMRYVYHLKGTPEAAKKILSNADLTSLPSMVKALRRTSYDPTVLEQDGWTVERAPEPVGATGGPHLIGDRLRWQNHDAAVIAYVHDNDIGDLWKAIWTDEDGDFEAFDLEAEELLESKRKWERRKQRLEQQQQQHRKVETKQPQTSDNLSPKGDAAKQAASKSSYGRGSFRYAASSDFTVNGIEHGIVLASSYSRGARRGVYWPARVMHASEKQSNTAAIGYGKADRGKQRSTAKQKVDVVFLAPYWHSDECNLGSYSRKIRLESMSETSLSSFSSAPLIQVETIDATPEMIKEYPFLNTDDDDNEESLDMDQLRMAFRFTGLPKAAFSRFVDSHRLAMSLKLYAKKHLSTNDDNNVLAASGLFDSHPIGVQAPTFPTVVLHLPFSFILQQLPRPTQSSEAGDSSSNNLAGVTEPVLRLDSMVAAMKPPMCFGESAGEEIPGTPKKIGSSGLASTTPRTWLASISRDNGGKALPLGLEELISDLDHLKAVFADAASVPPVAALLNNLNGCLSAFASEDLDPTKMSDSEVQRERLATLMKSWAMLKAHGEEAVALFSEPALKDWRRAAERIYKYSANQFSVGKFGNGVSVVLTDVRCNGHRTHSGSFERPVRLPAALKGAKLAGATLDGPTRLVHGVPDRYVQLVEEKILIKAHSASYLKRMKIRCSSASTEDEDLVLTDDSNGNGGEDTRGSRGTWSAAVTGVAAAVMATDMVVQGECVNAFCISRPPGHHAGRSLHAMKAVSNGFCVLNPVACAALYAVTPLMQGGLGLGRVCVFDFDVHHGNGTQDILCSTYDPRFLYVSVHAGGAAVNGVDREDDPDHQLHDLANSPKQKGIYPGRCGDTSPHKGVLNIPLGSKVTPHAVGSALLNKVTPAVDAFCPDLIILSAGFDAHKNDPMCLGDLQAVDFGHITEVACQLAHKSCSGRIFSVLEGGYGVPCCRPQKDIVLPGLAALSTKTAAATKPSVSQSSKERPHNTAGDLAGTQDFQAAAVEAAATTTTGERQTGTGVPPDVNGTAIGTSEPPESPQFTTLTKSSMPPTAVSPVASPPLAPQQNRPQPSKLLQLGEDLPDDMDDQVPYALQRRLEKCHAEGFIDCVRQHVNALKNCNTRK